jgi:DNA polymerase-3 subunit delta'
MWQTVGQDRAVAALQRALAGGRKAHAYLLAGPPQVGKATLARELAQALNCEGADPPCHECTPCRRIAAGIHADVQTVTVEAGNGAVHKDISIDQIREVGRTVSLRPFEGRCRAIIIDPADAMNEAAQNAFLKTLEEPPPDVVFLLITARPQLLRATIRSRCQRLDLRPLPVAAAQAALIERWGLPERRAELLARLSRGRLGWALAAQADEEMLRVRREALMDIRNLPRRSLVERFARAGDLASRFGRQREAVLDVLDLWGQWWRDVLLAAGGCQEAITNVDLSDILRAEAARYDPRQVAAFLRSLAAARRRLQENVNPRLALEVLLLDLPSPR